MGADRKPFEDTLAGTILRRLLLVALIGLNCSALFGCSALLKMIGLGLTGGQGANVELSNPNASAFAVRTAIGAKDPANGLYGVFDVPAGAMPANNSVPADVVPVAK